MGRLKIFKVETLIAVLLSEHPLQCAVLYLSTVLATSVGHLFNGSACVLADNFITAVACKTTVKTVPIAMYYQCVFTPPSFLLQTCAHVIQSATLNAVFNNLTSGTGYF